MEDFGFVFPAIMGVQARRAYYTVMCPLRLIPRLFRFDDEELPPEIRCQRVLNKNRLPEMSRYILDNPDDYVFSSITASIDGAVKFEAKGGGEKGTQIGVLRVPLDAKFIINDGQHRRAAIEMALRENPDIGNETISVVFFMDLGLARCQQMFADLNRHAIRPSKSIGVLYDHRDDKANLTRLMVIKSSYLPEIVEMERSTLSRRSRKLFTLSALYNANADLLDGLALPDQEKAAELAAGFWAVVWEQFPEWELVRERKVSAGEIRENYLHSHGLVLHALGRVGNVLLRDYPKQWKKMLVGLRSLNWSRKLDSPWEGRAMIGGRVSKGSNNLVLTTALIKKHIKVPLSPEESRLEGVHLNTRHG